MFRNAATGSQPQLFTFKMTAMVVNCRIGQDIYILNESRNVIYSFCAFSSNEMATASFTATYAYVQFRLNTFPLIYGHLAFSTNAATPISSSSSTTSTRTTTRTTTTTSTTRSTSSSTSVTNQEGCGVPSIQPLMTRQFKIINGVEAIPHSWPWYTHLKCPGSYQSSCIFLIILFFHQGRCILMDAVEL
jgi:hypothetical protein